jgi:hypothetical protein
VNAPAYDVALLLQTLGAGTFASATGWSVNVGVEPETPDTAVTVYDTPGDQPDTDELNVFWPRFQVRVRGPSYPAAYAKQEQIRDMLIYTQPLTMQTSRGRVTLTSDIMALGRDDSNRHILTANYRMMRSAL